MKKDTEAITPQARIVWPALFEPEAFNDSEPYYKALLLFEREADFSEIKAAIAAAARRKFPGQSDDFYKKLRKPIRNGNEKAVKENGEPDPESFYFNRLFINAKSRYQPQVVNKFNQPITDAAEVYGGCVVSACLSFFGYDYLGNKGVSAGLRAVIKIDDGEPIGGGKIDTGSVFDRFIEAAPTFTPDAFSVGEDIPY
jgi:hypothetical protein